MDVYHSSTTGIHDKKVANPMVGHADIWFNGGANGKTMSKKVTWPVNPHKSSVYLFGATILGECDFWAAKCTDPNWRPFSLDKWKKADTCYYGQYGADEYSVGQVWSLSSF